MGDGMLVYFGYPQAHEDDAERAVRAAKAATVERLFMICERQEWTFGETLEYALDALELALAKMARRP